MRKRDLWRVVVGIVAFEMLALAQAGGQSIGVNFVGRNNAGSSLAPEEVAGVVPQAYWRNAPHNENANWDDTLYFLRDSEGTETSVSFEYVANDAWSVNNVTPYSPDEALMKGIQKCNPDDGVFTPHANSRMTFYFRNLLPGSTYNVIVYQGHNDTDQAKSITSIGGVTYYAQQMTGTFDGEWTRSTSTTAGNYPAGTDYVQFDNVSPDASGTITIVAEKFLENPQVADGMGVPAVQLVKVSGEWPVITDPPVISTDPQDFLGVVGDRATFTIVTDGPWTIEWYKNDVLEQTGLSTTYAFFTAAADKDAVVYAKAINSLGETDSATAVIELDDPIPPQLVQGFMRGEHYGNIDGINVYPDLYNNARFQARDYDYEFFTLGADSAPTSPDGSDFGRVFEGWVVPNTTGNYRFFGNSDDTFELFINGTGGTADALPPLFTDFAAELPDATESSWQNRYVYFEPPAEQTTDPFYLEAGQYYAFAMLYKEGSGGDHASVAWREESDTTPVAELRPIGPKNIYCLASPAGKRAEFTAQPASQALEQGRIARFTIGVETRPRANEYVVQWTRNGVDIPGATALTYTTGRVTPAEDGDVYQAKVITLIGLLESDPATLAVTADATGPSVMSAGVFAGGSMVGIRFSEAMDAATAAGAGNYAVSGATVTQAELVGEDADIVLLTLSGPPTAGGTVTVSGVNDWSGNPVASTPVVLAESAMVPQQLVRSAGADPLEPGRAAYLGAGSFYMEAGGSDMWDNQDAGYQVIGSWTGPLDLRVRVESLLGPDVWTKGGIMVREFPMGGSRNVALIATPSAGMNIVNYQWRDTYDGASNSLAGELRYGPLLYPDVWLRIVRPDAASNLFESYLSPDGVNWTHYADHTISGAVLPPTVYVGIGSTSHNNGAGLLGRGLYSSYSVTSPGAVEPVVIDGLGLDGATLTIQWTGDGELQTAPTVDGPYTGTGDADGEYSEPLGADAQKYYRIMQP